MQSKDSHMMNEPTRRRMLIALACCGAAVGITALAAVRSVIRSRAAAESLRLATEKARPHIDKAVAESRAGIDEQLATIDAFFDKAKANAGGFADDMLGWTSKYKIVVGGHKSFVRRRFEARFFGPEELQKVMTATVSGYLAELEAIDNQMLVDMRADVADLPADLDLATISVPDLQERYRSACSRIARVAGADLTVDVGRVAADTVVSGIVAMMAARMGTSAAVLGSGAASGALTLGIGVVIGVIVDQIISTAWNWAYDPETRLVRMMRAKIDEVRKLVLDGDGDKPGLRAELQRLADQRATLRKEAVVQLLAGVIGG